MPPAHLAAAAALAAVLLGAAGCKHPVLLDDPRPLEYLRRVPVAVGYHVEPTTLEQVYAVPAWASGIFQEWILYPGQVLDQYSRAYFSRAFAVFQPAGAVIPGPDDLPFVLTTRIPYFEVSEQRAHLTVRATVRNAAGEVVYSGERTRRGEAGGGGRHLGGADVEKEMIRRSIDRAIRPALAELVSEMRESATTWRRPRPAESAAQTPTRGE